MILVAICRFKKIKPMLMMMRSGESAAKQLELMHLTQLHSVFGDNVSHLVCNMISIWFCLDFVSSITLKRMSFLTNVEFIQKSFIKSRILFPVVLWSHNLPHTKFWRQIDSLE